MDAPNLPFPPPEIGFNFRPHRPKELMKILGCGRSQFYEHLKKLRPYLGLIVRRRYSAEQVMVICLCLEPTEGYTQLNTWLELNKWKRYLLDKYNFLDYVNEKRRARGLPLVNKNGDWIE